MLILLGLMIGALGIGISILVGVLKWLLPVIIVIAAVSFGWFLFKKVFRFGWNIFKGSLVLSGAVLRSVAGPFVVAALIVGLMLLIF
ncbi:MAG: hypothetical protein IKI54_03835 [Lachnospiraceae bacterium]|nr:hypothetical protein [Lachnospiraceae bacterium]